MLAPARSSGYQNGMPLARRLSVVCAALALAGPAAARGEPPAATPAPAGPPPAASPSEQVPEDSPPAATEAPSR